MNVVGRCMSHARIESLAFEHASPTDGERRHLITCDDCGDCFNDLVSTRKLKPKTRLRKLHPSEIFLSLAFGGLVFATGGTALQIAALLLGFAVSFWNTFMGFRSAAR